MSNECCKLKRIENTIYYGVTGSGKSYKLETNLTLADVLEYTNYRHHFIKKNTENKWLFPSLNAVSGHITRGTFFRNLKLLALKVGINPNKVYPHVLRHSFATRLIDSDVDLRSIQKMLGHENIVTTEVYTHITTQKLVQEVKQKHPLMNKS
jgi:integrase/recombinase XerD